MAGKNRIDQCRPADQGPRRPRPAGTALAGGRTLTGTRPRTRRTPMAKPAGRQPDVFLCIRRIHYATTTGDLVATGRIGGLRSTPRAGPSAASPTTKHEEIGTASVRERVCQYV